MGIDLVRPFPPGKGGVKFIVVIMDYFTKWAEVEPLVIVTARSITRFLWKNVICRLGLPQSIISDNGRHFDLEHY